MIVVCCISGLTGGIETAGTAAPHSLADGIETAGTAAPHSPKQPFWDNTGDWFQHAQSAERPTGKRENTSHVRITRRIRISTICGVIKSHNRLRNSQLRTKTIVATDRRQTSDVGLAVLFRRLCRRRDVIICLVDRAFPAPDLGIFSRKSPRRSTKFPQQVSKNTT